MKAVKCINRISMVTTTARLRLRHHAPEEGEATT